MKKDRTEYFSDEIPVSLAKWTIRDLEFMNEDGYGIIPAKNEKEALSIRNALKQQKKNAQAGYIMNKDNKVVCFVVTRDRKTKNES